MAVVLVSVMPKTMRPAPSFSPVVFRSTNGGRTFQRRWTQPPNTCPVQGPATELLAIRLSHALLRGDSGIEFIEAQTVRSTGRWPMGVACCWERAPGGSGGDHKNCLSDPGSNVIYAGLITAARRSRFGSHRRRPCGLFVSNDRANCTP